jgi:arsenate reductase
MADKKKVLVVCVHNSARSQIAEEYIRKFGGDRFEVESAGLEPGELNPLVVEALKEDGIDISGKKTQDVFELYKKGRDYYHVITVCSREAGERCPVFPGPTVRHYWPYPDPAEFSGTREEKLEKVREIRDAIKEKIRSFVVDEDSAGADDSWGK